LDSKRPDGDSVKEISPLSKFLGICTTIQGHDVFVIPINKTVGAPSFYQAFNLQTFANLSFSSSINQRISKNQWRAVAPGAAPLKKQKEVVLAPVGAGDRQLPLRFFPDFLFTSDDLLLFQAYPMEPSPCAGHEFGSAGRLFGVEQLLPRALRGARRPPFQGGA
jgi:hypothetical protein